MNSDGALVNAHTGAVCVAYNGWGGAGVIVSSVAMVTLPYKVVLL